MLGLVAALLVLLAACRIYFILPRSQSKRASKRREGEATCRLAVFLGSGGHTAEALTLVSALDFCRYTPRIYIISQGDTLSARKAADLEKSKCSNPSDYRILTIPRARRVHQSLLTTPLSALSSLALCIYYVTMEPFVKRKPPFADLLLMNGPGTCLVLGIAVYVNKFLGLSAPRMIYVESFARVKTLSLSGRLLLPLVDRLIVQWPQLLRAGGREEYYGQLI